MTAPRPIPTPPTPAPDPRRPALSRLHGRQHGRRHEANPEALSGGRPRASGGVVTGAVVIGAMSLWACTVAPIDPNPAVTTSTTVISTTSTTAGTSSTTATTAPATTTTTAAPTCPTAAFPDLSSSGGAGAGYAKPSVQVSCSATELLVTSNGMISYPFVKMTPNALAAQSWSWHVPLDPTVAATPTSLVNRLGTLGFTVTGLPIYGPTEGPFPTAEAYGDPVVNGILDSCLGHTGPAKEYHNHALEDSSACGFGVSPILGYALDGFPIYGPRGCLDAACEQVVTFNSGYALTGDPTTYSWNAYTYQASADPTVLDSCNGRTLPDGSYAYYATDTFPYTFGCFRGTPTAQSGQAAAPMPPM